MKAATIILLGSLLAACAGARSAHQYYVLEASPPPAVQASGAIAAPTLLVAPTTALALYDTQDIVYSRARGTRAYFQLNRWTEPPGRRLDTLLVERLAGSGMFRSVAAATDGVRGRWILSAHLEEMYLDASTSPGITHIEMTVVLTDPARHSIDGRHRFVASAPATSPDAAGAVQGFDVALGPLLDQVADWARDTTAARSGGAP